MSTFGERLTEERKKAGFTQKSFAEALGISPTRLNYWEKDKREPDVFNIKKILELLKNTDSDYLLGVNEIKQASEPVSPDPEARKQAAIQHLMNALSHAGIIDRDGNMSDRDFEFLKGIVLAIRAHFDDDGQ